MSTEVGEAPEERGVRNLAGPVRVGMLGFGVVGTGAYRMLQDNQDAIRRKIGRTIEIVRVGIRDLEKPRMVPSDRVTTDLRSIVDAPEIDVVLELMGGVEPAGELIDRALKNGKHIVTANKELIAKKGAQLVNYAARHGLDLHYEAAVGGGIPLIQPLKHQLAGNDVIKMMGILNGTTNYILTKMAEEGSTYADALGEAQEKGYAEADPSSDVDGFDVQYKLAIVSSIAFGGEVAPDRVYREGIRQVSARDMGFAELLGYKIKLLGIVEEVGPGKILARVHPTLLPKEHPLAAVSGVYNALWFQGDFVGDVMFSGRGAGSDPTASAVVGDLIDVCRNLRVGTGSALPIEGTVATALIEELSTAYYVRLIVKDRPLVLGEIATTFGKFEVSLAAMEMRTLEGGMGEIVFLTHICNEKNFRASLEEIAKLDIIGQVCSWIRVEEKTL